MFCNLFMFYLIQIFYLISIQNNGLIYCLNDKNRRGDISGEYYPSNAIEFAPHHSKNKHENHLNKLRAYKKNDISDEEKLIEYFLNDYLNDKPNKNENRKKHKNNEEPDPFFSPEIQEKFMPNVANENREIVKANDELNRPLSKQISKLKINDDNNEHQRYDTVETAKKNEINDDLFGTKIDKSKKFDLIFYIILAGCSIAGMIAIITTGFCLYTMHRSSKAAANVDYPAFNNSKSDSKLNSITIGDRRLAQSAQMYHYQHQKQQMIAMEAKSEMKNENSDNSEGETEEGDYTVYECPGLAPTGEMEVKNPLFKEDFTTPIINSKNEINNQEAPITPNLNINTDEPNIQTPEASVPQMK